MAVLGRDRLPGVDIRVEPSERVAVRAIAQRHNRDPSACLLFSRDSSRQFAASGVSCAHDSRLSPTPGPDGTQRWPCRMVALAGLDGFGGYASGFACRHFPDCKVETALGHGAQSSTFCLRALRACYGVVEFLRGEAPSLASQDSLVCFLFEGCLASGWSGLGSCLFVCFGFGLRVFRVVEKPWESLGSLARRDCPGIGADYGLFFGGGFL